MTGEESPHPMASMGGHDEEGVPARTKERLLDAGRRLFSDRGFHGTSVRALTTEAGVNLGAVTYHFGSKEGLYEAVLDDCFGPVRQRVAMAARLPIPAMQRVELFVRGMYQHLTDNPELPRLIVQELVLGESPAPPILRMLRAVVGTLAEILEKGQEEGSIVSGDPVLQALSVLSQPIYLNVMSRTLKREDLREADLPRPQRSGENHAVSLLRRALGLPEEEGEEG